MKKVLITIKGLQGADGDSNTVEFMTEGIMRKAEDDYILSFNDTRILGDSDKNGVKTRITARGKNKVIVEREGGISSRLIIESGVRTTCFYSVPQGDLTLGIYGKTVKNGITDNGGRLLMTYSVDANMQRLSENSVEINVKEV